MPCAPGLIHACSFWFEFSSRALRSLLKLFLILAVHLSFPAGYDTLGEFRQRLSVVGSRLAAVNPHFAPASRFHCKTRSHRLRQLINAVSLNSFDCAGLEQNLNLAI